MSPGESVASCCGENRASTFTGAPGRSAVGPLSGASRARSRRGGVKNASWKSLKRSQLSPAARARVEKRVRTEVEELSLQGLRRCLELTQAEVGVNAAMTQSELSRLEGRDDHLTSTLRRYVEALGGTLEISAVFGKRRIKLTDA